MCVEADADFALSSDAHAPDQVGFGYDQALELLSDIGVERICVFDGRQRELEPLGPPGDGAGHLSSPDGAQT
jgi:histidinol-phosphatase (PHP family)